MKKLLNGDLFNDIDIVHRIQKNLIVVTVRIEQEIISLQELLQKCQGEVSALSTLHEKVETTTLYLNDAKQIVQTVVQSIDDEVSNLSGRIDKLSGEIEKLKQSLETQKIQSSESPPTTQDFL